MATYNGTNNPEIISAGIGADTIYGNDGADTLYGGGGGDRIIDHSTGNIIHGDLYADAPQDRAAVSWDKQEEIEMKHTLFADSIFNISVTGNLVRIDLGVAELGAVNADGKQEVKLAQSQQIVMPLDGFMRAFAIQEQVVQRLIKDGVIKMQPRETPAEATSPTSLN